MKNPKEIGWFKAIKGRHSKIQVTLYYAVREDGTVKSIDITRNRTSTIHGFSSQPMELKASTKEEFDKAFNQVVKN